jgi:hypothetical protein
MRPEPVQAGQPDGHLELEAELMQRMTTEQRSLFQAEVSRVRKNRTTALLLTLFLGGLGGHHFYMGNVFTGVMYLLFCWTFIPLLLSIVELFTISGRVDR